MRTMIPIGLSTADDRDALSGRVRRWLAAGLAALTFVACEENRPAPSPPVEEPTVQADEVEVPAPDLPSSDAQPAPDAATAEALRVGPMRCDELPGSVRLYEVVEHEGDRIRLRTVAEPREVLDLEVTRHDVNADGRPDLVGLLVEQSGDGDWHWSCGSYGECQYAVHVACSPGDRFAEVLAPRYVLALGPSGTSTVVGRRRWTDFVEAQRLGGDALSEADRIERGQPLTAEHVWHYADGAYRRAPP